MLINDINDHRATLQAFLAEAGGVPDLRIMNVTPIAHGVGGNNYALVIDAADLPAERRHLILRCENEGAISDVLTRAQEFAVLQTARNAGVNVPAVLIMCSELSVIGRNFFVMEHAPGLTTPHRLVKEDALVPDRAALAHALGENLGRIHRITQASDGLAFLRNPNQVQADSPAQAFVKNCRTHLDALPLAQPAFELGLRWCERNAPQVDMVTLVHRDFRTGNFLVHQGELSGVLDWEHARLGDPMEDIGWFFARCWRFGRAERQAGGLGPSDAFFAGYHAVRGIKPSAHAIHFWEVAAHIRWGIMAMQRAQRHMLGTQPSLELALTGRLPSELAHTMLRLMSEANA